MAKTYEYTPRRRMLMQVVVWTLLVLSLGAAAAVAHWKVKSIEVHLGEARSLAGVRVQMPVDWRVDVEIDGGMRVGQATENRAGGAARKLTVLRDQAGEASDALEYLIRRGVINSNPMDMALESGSNAEPIEMDGASGWLVEIQRRNVVGPRFRKQLIACAVIDRGKVLLISLTGVGKIEPWDRELIRQVAATAHLETEMPTRSIPRGNGNARRDSDGPV